VYQVQVYDGNKRKSLSLETTDHHTACLRYEAGHKALLKRIRDEHQRASEQAEGRWSPGRIATLQKQYKEQPELDYQDFAADVLGVSNQLDPATGELKDKKAEELAEMLAGQKQATVTWQELAANADKIRKRKTGKSYSAGWWKNFRFCIEQVTFSPTEATVPTINAWVDAKEEQGWSSATIKNRCSLLQGLLKKAKTSGFNRSLINGFLDIDFGTSVENNYYCPVESDYQWMTTRLETEPRAMQIAMKVLMYSGVRVNALTQLSEMTEPGWLDLPDEDGFKGGGRVPLPMDLWNQARTLKMPAPPQLNDLIRERYETRGNKKDEGKFSNHSWRSGFKRVSRMAKLDHVLQEALLTHALKKLEKTYGGDAFPDERLLDGAEKVWKEIDRITGV
jgi:hypothetical protein